MTAVPDHEFPLDPMEQAAAEDEANVVLALGGSGTGRTHTLAARVAFLLRRGASPGSIVCLSLTEGGPADLRRRLRMHPEIGGQAGLIHVGTFHQYANDILRDGGASALGLPPCYTVWDQKRALETLELTRRFRRRDLLAALRWHGLNQARWADSPEVPPRERRWREVVEFHTAEKNWQHALGLEDLLVGAIRVLELDEGIRSRWMPGHLLVDGFEDITPVQFRLLEQLTGSPRLMTGPSRSLTVAADPNQSLTGGPDRSYFTEYLKLRFPGLGTHELRLNQQGSQELWRMATTLAGCDAMNGLTPDGQLSYGVPAGRPRLVEVEGTLTDLDGHCLGEVLRLAGEGVPLENVAILYRRGNVIRRLRTRLVHLDIPHRVLGEERPERAGDARCLGALLSCALNPRDLSSFRIAAAPGHPNAGRRLSGGVCRRLRHLAEERELNLIQAAGDNLAVFRKDAAVFQGLSWLVEAWHSLDELLGDPEGSLPGLVVLALDSIRQAQPAGLTPVEEPELERLWALCNALPRRAHETPRQRLRRFLDLLSPALHAGGLPENGGLTLGAIQAAKGLRWPIVFILDVSDRTIPGGAGPHGDTRREQRLFHTAITRATRQLHLYSAADTGLAGGDRPSRFLDPVRDQLEHQRIGSRAGRPEGG